jgi:hypothetical protein
VVENYLELAADRKALIFAADLNHARSLAEAFKMQGVNAVWVSGETPLSLRRSFLEKLRNGEIKVIVNCMVFTEGLDEPSLDAILVARPTRSLVLYCQMIGRGLRPFPGKKNCLFIDFVDNSSKHRLISMQDLLMFYQTKKTEKNIAELLARKLVRDRQCSPGKKRQKSPVIDLSPTNLHLLVNLENLSSSVKEIDLFGLDAFAWYKVGAAHYVQVNDVFSLGIRPNSTRHILYAVFPKPGELDSLVGHLLSDKDRAANRGQARDAQGKIVPPDIWGPVWSNAAFIAVAVALGCWYTARKDF